MGGWPKDPKWKEVGQYNLHIVDGSLEGYVLFMLTNVMGWEYIEVQAFLTKTRATLRDKSVHPSFEAGTVWGQKPRATLLQLPNYLTRCREMEDTFRGETRSWCQL